jgi:hypothetical protein
MELGTRYAPEANLTCAGAAARLHRAAPIDLRVQTSHGSIRVEDAAETRKSAASRDRTLCVSRSSAA